MAGFDLLPFDRRMLSLPYVGHPWKCYIGCIVEYKMNIFVCMSGLLINTFYLMSDLTLNKNNRLETRVVFAIIHATNFVDPNW